MNEVPICKMLRNGTRIWDAIFSKGMGLMKLAGFEADYGDVAGEIYRLRARK